MPLPSDYNRSNSVLLHDPMFAASMYGTLKIEKGWATSSEFARKFPVLIGFAIVVGTSTWQPQIDSSIFRTIATPNAFDCLSRHMYVSQGLGGSASSDTADNFNIILWTTSGILSHPFDCSLVSPPVNVASP
jgi:hypothetical protein